MKTPNYKTMLSYLGIFVALFAFFFILDKLAGDNPIFTMLWMPRTSYSWKEMLKEIPFIAIMSFLLTLWLWHFNKKKNKPEK